jgi:endonuclease III
MTNHDLAETFERLRAASRDWMQPIVTEMANRGASHFEILIAAVLSARTLDTVTVKVYPKLFALAKTPRAMAALSEKEIETAIRSVAFPAQKAKQVRELSRLLVEKYDGRVPETIEELVQLPGVGRKVANLVVVEAFDQPGICVDTHVHRITNRWGYVKTKTPEETEMKLREILPPRHWKEINPLLVALGQNICRPTSPKCSVCPIAEFCAKLGVEKSR